MNNSYDGTSINSEELTALLNKAVNKAIFDIPRWGTVQASQLQHLYGRNADANGRFWVALATPQLDDGLFTKLTDLLRSHLRTYIANDRIGNGLAYLRGGVTELALTLLTKNLIRSAAILGPERVVQRLYEWESGEPINYRSCAILFGLSLDEPLAMDQGIRFEKLPTSWPELESYLPLGSTMHLGYGDLMGALKVTIDCSAVPVFYKPGVTEPTHKRTWTHGIVPENLLDILCEVLSLTHNHHVSWKMQWVECDDLIVMGLGSGYSSRPGNGAFSGGTQMSQECLEQARTLLVKRIADLNSNKRLNLAISRWMGSKQRAKFADQFIELRIALEALYVGSGRSELSFRIASHGAWHLGSNFEDRLRYYTILRDAYSKASSAVHAGEVTTTDGNRDLLVAAQDLCRDGILKRLEERAEPDWNEMILGAEL